MENLPAREHPSLADRLGSGLHAFWRENRQFLFLLACIFLFKSAVADLSSISGASMQPTLLDGDKVWVNKLAYDIRVPFTEISLANLAEPERGDIVIIDSAEAGKRLVKRIVGLPGDALYLQNNNLVVNGEPARYQVISEDVDSVVLLEQLPNYAHEAMLSNRYSSGNYPTVIVPEGHYFVLGDNRDQSADSRAYGFVPREEIIGRSRSVVFSLDAENRYLPRSDRFLAGLH
jgi:signal peptidase I